MHSRGLLWTLLPQQNFNMNFISRFRLTFLLEFEEIRIHPHCLFSWKVTSNKMQGHFWHLFLTQLFMLFHMVASVLLSMVAFSTVFLLVKILQQPIRIIEISGYWSCHGEENACYHVKEHKKLGQKLVSKVTLHFVWGHFSRKQTVAWPYLKYNHCNRQIEIINYLLEYISGMFFYFFDWSSILCI